MRISIAIWCTLLNITLFHVVQSQQVHFVTNSSDNDEGSLRQVLLQTEAFDTIRFLVEIDTIFLTSEELLINKSIILAGNAGKTFLKQNNNTLSFRLIRIESAETIEVKFLNIGFTGGFAPPGTELTVNGENGGAVLVDNSIHLIIFKGCVFTNNRSGDGVSDAWNGEYYAGKGGHGGAIYSNSRLRLESCSFLNNYCGTGGQCHQIEWDWYILIGEDGGSGGAVFCTSILEMENCLFESNRAGNGRSALGSGSDYVDAKAGQGGDGGAVVMNGDSLVVTNCQFIDNKAGTGGFARSNDSGSTKKGGDGGALCITGAFAWISNSLFTGNYSGTGGSVPETGGSGGYGKNGGDGGAISLKESVLMMNSTEFNGNQTGNGGLGDQNYGGDGGNGGNGGAISSQYSEFHLLDCKIYSNITGNGGKGPGGMHSELEMNGGSGGGLFIRSALINCSVKNCAITNNTCGNGGIHLDYMRPGASGGHGGGIAFTETPGSMTLNLINCDISFNKSGFAYVPEESYYGIVYPRGGSGGGIYCPAGGISLVNVTCVGNKAGSAYFTEISATDSAIIFEAIRGYGGGIFDTTGTSLMMNSLFALNKIYTDSIPSENDLEGIFNIDFSLFCNSGDFTFYGENNLICVEPQFLNYPESLILSEYSPAIDAGNPDTTGLNIPELDLDGNSRIVNLVIDMGAYEYFAGSNIQADDEQGLIVHCYPNPSDGLVTFDLTLKRNESGVIIICDCSGRIVDQINYEGSANSNPKISWNPVLQAPGPYFCKILSTHPNSPNHTAKIILLP